MRGQEEYLFGGIQVICSGDFLQLPFIHKDTKDRAPPGQQQKKYEKASKKVKPLVPEEDFGKFCFESKRWQNLFGVPPAANGKTLFVLRTPFRQSGDNDYYKILSQLRIGNALSWHRDWLGSRMAHKIQAGFPRAIALYPVNKLVDSRNARELASLPDTTTVTLYGSDIAAYQDFPALEELLRELPVPREIMIKRQARIMLRKNFINFGLSNGSMGTVIDILDVTTMDYKHNMELYDALQKQKLGVITNDYYELCFDTAARRFYISRKSLASPNTSCDRQTPFKWLPVVTFDTQPDQRYLVLPNQFDVFSRVVVDDEAADGRRIKRFQNIVIATRHQYPLILGFAISIHKSQGLTLEWAEMDLEQCFASGQAYVALSRVKELKRLKLLSMPNWQKLRDSINPQLIRYDIDLNTVVPLPRLPAPQTKKTTTAAATASPAK